MWNFTLTTLTAKKGNLHSRRCSLEEMDVRDGEGLAISAIMVRQGVRWLSEPLVEVGRNIDLKIV